MAKTKAEKPKKRKFRNYSQNSVSEALSKIRANELTLRKASVRYNVPKSTLSDILRGRVPEDFRRMGPDTVLTDAEEKRLVEWCITLAKCGFPRRNEDLLQTVQKIVIDDGRKTPFKSGRPGKKWLHSFFTRHPELSQRTSEGISKGRAVVTEQTLRKWFTELELFLKENHYEDVLSDPTRIFNGDEAGFSLCPKAGKVIGPKGWKNVYNTQMGNEKENITVLLVFSASGETLPPVIVYPYVRPPRDVINSMPPRWILGRSESGWMNSDVFYEYVANSFNEWVEEKNIQKPVLLFIDGHKSHMTMHLSEACDRHGIILYALPPNATHIMQPADVSVFRPVKANWKDTLKEWQSLPENVNSVLTKATFAPLLEKTLTAPSLPDTIRNGFRTCGLYPFNPNAVDYSKCVQNNIESLCPRESTSDHQPDLRDIQSAEKVIKSIAANLEATGMDVGIILQEIHRLRYTLSSPAESSNDVVNNSPLIEINLPVIEKAPSDMLVEMEDILNGEIIFHLSDHDVVAPTETSNSVTRRTDILFEASLLPEAILENSSLKDTTRDFGTKTTIHSQQHSVVGISPSPVTEIPDNCLPSPLSFENHEPVEVTREAVTLLPNPCPKSTDGKGNIASAFDRHLFTPKPIAKSTRRQPRDRVPSAISSAAWRQHMIKKEEEKNSIEENKKRKKEERENKKLNKLGKKTNREDTSPVGEIKRRKTEEIKRQNLSKLKEETIKQESVKNCLAATKRSGKKNKESDQEISNKRPRRTVVKKN